MVRLAALYAFGTGTFEFLRGLGGPDAIETAADLGCDVVIMHMQGEPGTMQDEPRYGNVVAEDRCQVIHAPAGRWAVVVCRRPRRE